MSEIIVVNPTKSIGTVSGKIRVAPYIRVSSDSDDQENSYIVQYDYYINLINSNPDWVLVDVYADEGITGTSIDKRDDFNRMYEDCKDGKIDLILTKSISRFARNTLDCIEYARKLKYFGAGIYFEKENLNTMDMASEVELAALGSIAQEESMSISENVRMGVQYRMKNGTFIQVTMPYGYKLENNEWVIIEERAKVVRLIFNAYINGNSLKKIADQLTEAKVLKDDGTYIWRERHIAYIIRNVRYKGDALLQKTYTKDFPFKKRTNHGERDMYYYKNANPAIVSSEVFDKANRLLDIQSGRFKATGDKTVYTLTKKVYCMECGTIYRRKQGNIKVYWVCRKKDHDGKDCQAPQIAEEVLYSGFVNVYNRLVNNYEIILTPIVTQLTAFKNKKLRTTGVIENINKEIAEISEQILMYREMKSQGYMESALFIEKSNEAKNKIVQLQKNKKLLLGNDECEKVIKQTEAIINIIKLTGAISEIEEILFNKIIRKIWVDKNKNLIYELTNGLKLPLDYQEVI